MHLLVILQRYYKMLGPTIKRFMEIHITVLEFSYAQTDRRSNKVIKHSLKNTQITEVKQLFCLYSSHSVSIYFWNTGFTEKNTHIAPPSLTVHVSLWKKIPVWNISFYRQKLRWRKVALYRGLTVHTYVLGAFAKLRKTTICFIKSARPHGTNRLILDVFVFF
jgi:hypothetical protein